MLRSFSVECLVTVGLYQRFIYTLAGPAVAIAGVALWGQMGGRSKVQVLVAGQVSVDSVDPGHDRSSKANQIIMAIIFLVYPSVSTTIFSVFACRHLDFEQSVHVYDAAIDCHGAEYKVLRDAALVALVLVPIGVPVGFAYLLFKNRSRLGKRPEENISFEVFSTTARSVLKATTLSDADLQAMYAHIDTDKSGGVSSEELWRSALEAVHSSVIASEGRGGASGGDELRESEAAVVAAPSEDRNGTGGMVKKKKKKKWWEGGPKEYHFLVRAYEPRCYWYELVHYGKKFVLSGVLVFAGPGSTAQLYVGLVVSFYFFALLARCTPYKNSKTDRTAVIVEANLFFTLLCLLMLKMNLTGEWLRREFYDAALASSNVVVALAPTGIAVVIGFHRLASEWADSASEPLSKGDRVRILECSQSLQSCGKVATVMHSTAEAITVRVRINAASAKKAGSLEKRCSCLRCSKGRTVLEHQLERHQLQLILSRKQFLRLCVGVCKQLLLCFRARGALDRGLDAQEGQTTDKTAAMAQDIMGVEDIEADDDVFDDINLKEVALGALRSACEPALARRGITWEHAKHVIAKLSSLSELQQAIEDPEAFVQAQWVLFEPLIKEALLAKLRPHAEPQLQKHGVSWEHAKRVLNMVTSINRLHAALENPQAFASELVSASGPAAKAIAIAKLRPVLEPMLDAPGPADRSGAVVAGLQWEALVPVLGLVDSLEELEAAVSDPEGFLQSLLTAGSVAGKALLVAKLRPVLEPMLSQHAPGMAWEQLAALLGTVETSVEQLEAALGDPVDFLKQLVLDGNALVA
jgi:hypothetical protein